MSITKNFDSNELAKRITGVVGRSRQGNSGNVFVFVVFLASSCDSKSPQVDEKLVLPLMFQLRNKQEKIFKAGLGVQFDDCSGVLLDRMKERPHTVNEWIDACWPDIQKILVQKFEDRRFDVSYSSVSVFRQKPKSFPVTVSPRMKSGSVVGKPGRKYKSA